MSTKVLIALLSAVVLLVGAVWTVQSYKARQEASQAQSKNATPFTNPFAEKPGNSFSQTTGSFQNPFSQPSPTTYQNPFDTATTGSQSYQNPFEALR